MEKTAQLTLDILTVVLSHVVRRHDILSLMRTCKPVYAAGIPVLLKKRVLLNKQRKLSSFCDFILADAPNRGKHVRDLEFCQALGPVKDEKFAERIAQVLQHATGLEKLSLDHCEDFVASNNQISEAFAQLKSVKELTAQYAGIAIVDAVKKMRSPVEYVSLSVRGVSHGDQDPVSILAPFQETLQKVYLWLPEFRDETQGIVFPKLHTLDTVLWNNIEMRPMIRAFPNLKNLSLYLQGYSDGGLEDDKDEIREKNAQAQETARWEHLEKVVGDDINLYISALKSDIDELELRLNWEAEAELLTAVLEDARPKRLSLRYESDWSDEGAPDHFTSVAEAVANDITHLYITVRSIDDSEEAITLLCDTISSMPKLVSLSLEVAQSDADAEESDDEVVHQFTDAAKSLETVILNLSYSRRSVWQVEKAGTDADSTLRELSKEECKQRGLAAPELTFNFDF